MAYKLQGTNTDKQPASDQIVALFRGLHEHSHTAGLPIEAYSIFRYMYWVSSNRQTLIRTIQTMQFMCDWQQLI